MIMSNGTKIKNPKFLSKTKKKLGRAQKILARKTKGSSNYEQQRVKVAKLHEKVTNQRKDLYHNISRHLVSEYDTIVFESLNVKGMVKNHCLASAIADASWSTLLSMVEYKCNWYGKTFHKIDQWFPSTKTCSSCGEKCDSLTLSVREWYCSSCGAHHDRDLNAAINIHHRGLSDLYGEEFLPSNRGVGVVSIPRALQKHVVKTERFLPEQIVTGKHTTSNTTL